MNYSEINRDYLIRINNPEFNYKGLVSARMFELIANEGSKDKDLAKRIIQRVYNSPDQVLEIKLRRGIQFVFVYR